MQIWVFSTGSNAGSGTAVNGCSVSHEDSYSMLVHYIQPDQNFQTLREISYVEPENQEESPDPENREGQRSHFLFTSLHFPTLSNVRFFEGLPAPSSPPI